MNHDVSTNNNPVQGLALLQRFLRGAFWALVSMTFSAILVIALGQLYATVVGGGCTVLCDPQVAGATGAVSGLLAYVFQKTA